MGASFIQGQPLPTATPTLVPIEGVEPGDFTNAAYNEFLEKAYGAAAVGVTKNRPQWAIRAFGRLAGPATGISLSVAPNMIQNIQSGQGGTAKFWADVVVDATGYGVASGLGALAFVGVGMLAPPVAPYVGGAVTVFVSVAWDGAAPQMSMWVERRFLQLAN